jgi:ubiquinone/menaquinone biosynthesis C-methylase UbiE
MKMAVINEIRDFWNRNLCMDNLIKAPYLSTEYFRESTELRYKYHYHIPRDIEQLSKMKPGGKVLEIGPGMGCDTQLLCEKGLEVTAIDLTSKSVETTKVRLAHFNLPAVVITGNAEALQFQDETFDAVYSFGVLHHTPDTYKSIDEVHRVLKKGGIALIMLYNRKSLNYLAHVITRTQFDGTRKDPCPEEKAYTKQEIIKMFNNFSAVMVKPDYLFGTGWKQINWFVPLFIKKPLGKLIGWHNMIWAVK